MYINSLKHEYLELERLFLFMFSHVQSMLQMTLVVSLLASVPKGRVYGFVYGFTLDGRFSLISGKVTR